MNPRVVLAFCAVAISVAFATGCTGAPPTTDVPQSEEAPRSAAAPSPPATTALPGGLTTPSISSGPSDGLPVTRTPPARSVDPAAVANARQLIESTDLTNPDSLDEIAAARFTAGGEIASRDLLAAATTRDVLWAAVWVYSSAGTDPAPLRPLLAHDDPSIRVMAAATLVSLGDAGGFAGLLEALADDGGLLGSEPPISRQQFAQLTLASYVSADGTPAPPDTEEDESASVSAWTSWLAQNSAQLQFDPDEGTWKL